ncbi:hypothetical protein, partial [Listeria ivanovii]|uniref:hypothetical protein n=1 Tax=Listeria ivanovii TaxID=1638 RepID=UPI001F1DDFE0
AITTFAVLVSFHYFSLESIIIFSQLKYASKVRFFGLTLGAHYSQEFLALVFLFPLFICV